MNEYGNTCHFPAHTQNPSLSEDLWLNTACSTSQSKQQPHLPFNITPC